MHTKVLRSAILALSFVCGIAVNGSGAETAVSVPKNRNAVRAMYLSITNVYSEKRISEIEAILAETNANAVVIDYKADSVLPNKRAEELVRRFKRLNAYLIARIVVMQDSYLATANPKLAIRHKDGSLWTSGRPSWKRYWVDPSAAEVLNYNLEISKAAIDVGFDELNFDYIRFPSDGKMSDIVYPVWNGVESRAAIMDGFCRKLANELRRYNAKVKLSVDVFGDVAAFGKENGIGQEFIALAKNFDVIAPMAYPSHYRCGEFGLADPNAHPYEVMKKTLAAGKTFLGETGLPTEIRPWIQAFGLRSIYRCGPYIPYGSDMVHAQIKAAEELGIHSFMLWNAGSSYSPRYFEK